MMSRPQRWFLMPVALVIVTPAFAAAQGHLALNSNTGNVYQLGIAAVDAFDSSGNKLWESVPFPGTVAGFAIDSNTGNVYVAGTSPGAGSGTDYHTLAYDSNGNQLWEARYHGPSTANDVAHGIAVDSSTGNVYVTGQSWFSQFGSMISATVAYDFMGNQLWVGGHRVTPGGTWSLFAAVDGPSGNVFVTGVDAGAGPSQIDTVAYDGTGTMLWAHFQSCPDVETPSGIVVGGTGNVYVTGTCRELGTAGTSYITVGYDANGNVVFFAKYQALIGHNSTGKAIAVDPTTEQIYVTGNPGVPGAPGTFAYALGIGKLWEAPEGCGVAIDGVSGNVYVASGPTAYDSSGNQLWQGASGGCDIVVDSNLGNIYLLGPAAYDSSGNKLWGP